MKKNEIWQQLKNDTTKVYGQPIFDTFLKVTDTIHKLHYVNLTKDQKKSLKLILRLKMAPAVFNKKEELEIIDSAFEDVEQSQRKQKI